MGDPELQWSDIAIPGANAWTLSVLTAFLRIAASANPFISVTLGEQCPDWIRKMQKVVMWTRVHFPVKENEQSMEHYQAYRAYMAKLRRYGDAEISSSATYSATVAVIITCEWMRNSAKVSSVLQPFPYNIQAFQDNLWREFGDPMVHMDVHVSSTKNTDAVRLRAPHLHMGASEMFNYLVFRKRSWKEPMDLSDLMYCLRLTTASNLLRNHCYAVLRHLGLVPKLEIPTDAASQGQNTRKFCIQSSEPPADFPRDVRRLLALYDMEVTVLAACPYGNLNALIRTLSAPVNRLIWVCQHLILLHNSALEPGSPNWSHPRLCEEHEVSKGQKRKRSNA